MEALTALSVATSIIQFVDFGSKLLSNSRKLYKSAGGGLSPNIDVETLTNDVVTLVQGLRRKLPEHRPPSTSNSSTSARSLEDSDALDELCRRSLEIAEELQRRLDKLKIKPPKLKAPRQPGATSHRPDNLTVASTNIANIDFHQRHSEPAPTNSNNVQSQHQLPSLLRPTEEHREFMRFRSWSSFRKALEAAWSKKEIESLVATLEDFRSEIEFRMLVMFRCSLNDLAVEQSHISKQIAQSTQKILDSFVDTRDSFSSQLQSQAKIILEIQDFQKWGRTEDRQKIEEYLLGDLGPVGSFQHSISDKDSDDRVREPARRDNEIQKEIRLLMTENDILRSLSFATLMDRQESVDLPYQQTFQWIFDEANETKHPWSPFTEWLREANGIYWINGKVGSGKSTLMRYIFENQRTKQELKSWAGDMSTETYGFFFWNSGDENQKSQQGLLRSLLFNILQHHRDLIPEVFPDVWAKWSIRSTAAVSHHLLPGSALLPPEPAPWSMVQLKRGFQSIINNFQGKIKLCLFIDGLDEYGGDYFDIIELFQEYATSPHLKLCVSSRPLLAFTQAFANFPSLKMQDMTQGDIGHFVQDRLYSHSYMLQLSEHHTTEVSLLVGEIVSKARGVFLWVKLVVRSLVRGLSDYNRMSDLFKRVRHLPEDLEALYAHMLKHTDSFYHEHASQIFQIVRTAQERSPNSLSLLKLSWAEDEDSKRAETAPVRHIQEEEVKMRCETMDARLKSVCAGLLESAETRYSDIAPDARVVFLHRTVSDWLSKKSVWEELCSRTADSDFNANLSMLRSCIMELKTLEADPSLPLDMTVVSDALQYAREAEIGIGAGFPKLLDQLDVVVSYHWRIKSGHYCTATRIRRISNTMSGNGNMLRHWSSALEIAGTKSFEGPSAFYDLARHLRISHYVAAKYDSGVIVDQDVNQYLLSNAVSFDNKGLEAKRRGPDVQLIDTALQAGANPNLSYTGATPWEAALLAASSHFSSGESSLESRVGMANAQWEQTAENWACVIEAFIRHGADVHLLTGRQRNLLHPRRLSPLAVIDMFPQCLTDKGLELKELLHDRTSPFRKTQPSTVNDSTPMERDSTPIERNSTPVESVKTTTKSRDARTASLLGSWGFSWFWMSK